MDAAVVVEDSNGRICYWNQSAERILGYSKEEACLNYIEVLIPEEARGDFAKCLKVVFTGRPLLDVETLRRTKDGREIEVLESFLPVCPEAESISAIVHLIRDPADVRREKALETLSNQPQIALTLAHELRNPLLALNNLAILMEHRIDPKYLPVMKRQLALCDSIITNILESTVTGKPQKQAVPLQELLDQVLSLINIPANIQLECNRAGDVLLWIDPDQIRQTFLNLLHNALEAMGDKSGILEITVDDQSNAAHVHFSDTGPGMTDAIFKKIFQPLVTTKKKGMGLGLLTCKQLVEANGGTIAVENRRGRGCTFSLTLPKP
jgi:PAS domain S-box-containing protein